MEGDILIAKQDYPSAFTLSLKHIFNSNRFDIPVLAEEFLRAGVDIDMSRRKFVDVQVIFHKMEQRTLLSLIHISYRPPFGRGLWRNYGFGL